MCNSSGFFSNGKSIKESEFMDRVTKRCELYENRGQGGIYGCLFT